MKLFKTIAMTAAAAAVFSAPAQQQRGPAADRPADRPGARAEGQADRAERRPGEGGRMGGRMTMGPGGFDQSMLLLRLMDDPETAASLKLTDEQKAALKKGAQAMDERQAAVSEALRVAALEQAALAAKVMADKQASTNELMALVEKVGALRTEQAKIQTEKLLVIRDTLTAEQIRAAGELATKRMEQMRERMRERMRQRPERAPGAGGGDRRNAPLPQRPQGWDE